MFVDVAVSKTKVDREVSEYLHFAESYRKRGIWLLDYSFPEVLFAFSAVNAKPNLIPFGVLFDFSNYDVWPASIKFVNPATKQPLKRNEILGSFARHMPNCPQEVFLQAWSPDDDRPFMCLQGVREYHQNSAHTGDPWFLHRGSGVGKLVYLLDKLARYGSEPIQGLTYQMNIQMNGIQATLVTQ